MHTNPALPHLDRPPHVPHCYIRVCKLQRWWGVAVSPEGDAVAISNMDPWAARLHAHQFSFASLTVGAAIHYTVWAAIQRIQQRAQPTAEVWLVVPPPLRQRPQQQLGHLQRGSSQLMLACETGRVAQGGQLAGRQNQAGVATLHCLPRTSPVWLSSPGGTLHK